MEREDANVNVEKPDPLDGTIPPKPTSPKPETAPEEERDRLPGEPDDDAGGVPFTPYTPGIDDVAGREEE